MNKKLLLIAMILISLFVNTFSASAIDAPEAYMGFSVPDEWYVFSKNMTDRALLDAVGLDADEVNRSLVKSDCEYLILNPENNSEIYVKIKKNQIAQELYNLSNVDDERIQTNLDNILKNGFSVDGFVYDSADVHIASYAQMKFVIVPGIVMYDGKSHGLVLGFTFVNGNGIGFILYLDKDAAEEEDLQTITELANSLTFTVIRDKTTDVYLDEEEEKVRDSALAYIAGGLGGIALIAFCLYFIFGIRKSESVENINENTENETTD